VRAGLRDEGDYLKRLGERIDGHRRLPGARVQSLAEASFDAWVSAGGPDARNSQVSFYGQGELVSLLLDMEIRRRTSNRVSFDDVLRTALERHPLADGGYTTVDLLAILEELTESSFVPFFARHVGGTEPLPLEEALLTVGLELHFEGKKDDDEDDEEGAGDAAPEEEDAQVEIPTKAYLGLSLGEGGSGARVRRVSSDGPAYAAGLVAGDEILTMDGRRLRPGDLEERLERRQPGDRVRFHFLRRDRLEVLAVVLGATADGEWKLRRVEQPSDAQRAAYESWCGREWPAEEDPEDAGEEEGPAGDGE
jgi:predicted metalloprotease with PDZ domain